MQELEYLEKCKRTLSTKDDLLEHMIIGCVTEVVELADAYKKHKFYKRDLNKISNRSKGISFCFFYLLYLFFIYNSTKSYDINIFI